MTLDNNAIEAGLRHFVKTNKKVDFIGKQALQEMTTREGALPRRLVFMEVDTDNVDPEGNETIWRNDKVNFKHIQWILNALKVFQDKYAFE